MAKRRTFSIYLLKDGFDASNSLKSDHDLQEGFEAKDLPEGAKIFVLDSAPRDPWWKSYFAITAPLSQTQKGALVFIPVDDRTFALSFGHVSHNLKDISYEHDFGLRVTLNSVDPQKLKSSDILEPSAARRQRIQLPTDSDLTLFDFDRESTVLRRITGKVKDEYSDLFRNATGASNLRISTAVTPGNLASLCEELITLYRSEDYKKSFPDIHNIAPINDPTEIATLNGLLISAIREKSIDVNLTVPDIINYSDNVFSSFSGAGKSHVYDDVYIGSYYKYLESNNFDINSIALDDLKEHQLVLCDEEGVSSDRFTILKSLVFETAIPSQPTGIFHICEGTWYRVETSYIQSINEYIDTYFKPSTLPDYTQSNEGDYNSFVPTVDSKAICLDKSNISPDGSTQIEPCDILTVADDLVALCHIKISTLSAQLSHLFNQGINSVEAIRSDTDCLDNLIQLISERGKGRDPEGLIKKVNNDDYVIVFGIITRKDPIYKSLNLPLFSRISLRRSLKALQIMRVPAQVIFIPDKSPDSTGKKKPRKKKLSGAY